MIKAIVFELEGTLVQSEKLKASPTPSQCSGCEG